VRDGVDIIGRYGGEEFIAILPDADLYDGVLVADRMRRLVESLAICHEHSHAGVVTVSIGVGTGRFGDADSLRAAIAAADAALYEAKAAGRNCVRPPVGKSIAAFPPVRVA
jgi:diguanylate cyclase (GGDEF)-like protein